MQQAQTQEQTQTQAPPPLSPPPPIKNEILTQLRTIYDHQPLYAIETSLTITRETMISARRKLTLGLLYLQHTNRYREHKGYEKACFEDYIKNMFGVTTQTYGLDLKCFIHFEPEVEVYGLGMVQRAIKELEVVGAKRLFRCLPPNTTATELSKFITANKKPIHDPPQVCPPIETSPVATTDMLKTKDEQIIDLTRQVEELEIRVASLTKERDMYKEKCLKYEAMQG